MLNIMRMHQSERKLSVACQASLCLIDARIGRSALSILIDRAHCYLTMGRLFGHTASLRALLSLTANLDVRAAAHAARRRSLQLYQARHSDHCLLGQFGRL